MVAVRNTRERQLAKLGRPIFVVGYMHSGTTLLLKILGRHPSVFSGEAETKYFECLPLIRHSYPDLHDTQKLREFLPFVAAVVQRGYKIGGIHSAGPSEATTELVDTVLPEAVTKPGRDPHGEMFRIVSDYLTRAAGRTRWLEKTPTHILHVDQIIESVPDALFVEIVRDARDVLASKKTRREIVWQTDRYSPEQKPLKHLEKAYDPLWDSLSWKATVRAGHSARTKYSDRFITVRYEDLVKAPEARVKEICDFLGLDFQAQMLEVSSRNSAERGEVKKEGIAADAVGRWRRTLTPAEAALCQLLVKSDLERWNYGPETSSLSAHARTPLLIARSLFEFLQRLSRRVRLGGPAYSINVLLTYWKRATKLVNS